MKKETAEQQLCKMGQRLHLAAQAFETQAANYAAEYGAEGLAGGEMAARGVEDAIQKMLGVAGRLSALTGRAPAAEATERAAQAANFTRKEGGRTPLLGGKAPRYKDLS
jgi:hypothetical protein